MEDFFGRIFIGGIFWETFFGRIWNFLGGFFWENFYRRNIERIFLTEFFGRNVLGGYFGKIFLGGFLWEEFFGRTFERNSKKIILILKELICLSRFWFLSRFCT